MASTQRLSLAWTVALVACGVGVVFMVGVPRKRGAPEPFQPRPADAPAAGARPLQAPERGARPAVDAVALERVRAVLAPRASAKPPPEAGAMAKSIVRLGTPALAAAIALVCGDEDPLPSADGSPDEPIHPLALERREAILRDAIRGFDPAQSVACIAERSEDASIDVLRVLVQLLGEVDHRTALPELLRIVATIDPIQFGRTYVAQPIEEAIASQLRLRPQSVRELRKCARDVDPGLAALLVHAAGSVRTSASIDFAVDLFGRDEALDIEILRTLTRSGGGGRLALDERALDALRRAANSASDDVRRAAFDALGTLADGGVVDELIDGLDAEDALVARAARGALTTISGSDRGAEARAWQAWRDEEWAWRDTRGEGLASQLESDDVGSVVSAIRELASHPLFRLECADAIAPLVAADDDAISRAACEALIASGSGRALPALLAQLAETSDARRERAHAALIALTGLSLPPDLDAWMQALAR